MIPIVTNWTFDQSCTCRVHATQRTSALSNSTVTQETPRRLTHGEDARIKVRKEEEEATPDLPCPNLPVEGSKAGSCQ